jgi:3-dehydrotetronate 4-kinase
VGAEIAAGVPVLRAIGTKQAGTEHCQMLTGLTSGHFGRPEFFSDALGAALNFERL